MTNDNFDALAATARHSPPEVAVVLGSGLSDVVQRVRASHRVPFAEIPGLAGTSIPGHRGRLTLGTWAGRRVLVFAGRLHYYEGHPWGRVVLPVRTARLLGARVLLVTNAAGGIHEELTPGSLMALRDHIDWMGPHRIGPARPSPYSARLLDVLARAADEAGVPLRQGIYAAVTGPSYETPAEIRALRICGADAVGMSTAREVQAGHDDGLECAGLSCITNRAAGLSAAPIHHGEVLTTAAAQSGRLAALLERFLPLA